MSLKHPHGYGCPGNYLVLEQEAFRIAEVFVQQLASRLGTQFKIHSKQRTDFPFTVFISLCRHLGSDKMQITPLYPEPDTTLERFNRTILNNLSVMVTRNHQEWDQKLPLFLLTYRIALHETTSYISTQRLFSREVCLLSHLLFT